LELRNAHFNLNRLGAICRKYLPNFYGVTTSPLHRGLPTDRLLAEWHLDSPRVMTAVAGAQIPPPEYSTAIELPAEVGRRGSSEAQINAQQTADLLQLLKDKFLAHFQRGYAAVAVRTDAASPAYLLCPWSDF
jgi:predicted GNAT superfamily acetyltransferase